MTKKTYKVSGMDCDACAKLIELDLEDAGITANCSYQKQEIVVDEATSFERLKDIVKKGGYELSS